MKKQENNIICDINSFDKEASIYKILFQDRTTALLKYIIDKISIDRYENVNFRLPSILIAGREGKIEGKQLIIRAFSNSLCSDFEYIQGKYLSMGGWSSSLYRNVNSETVYYINLADELSPSSITTLHKFLIHGFAKFKNPISQETIKVSTKNKLFVFSVNDSKQLCSDLYKAIDYHCYLKIITILKWSS